MLQDSEGFAYPIVDKQNCIDCHLCERTCPQLQSKNAIHQNICYAAMSKDLHDVNTSSSGGIFVQVAKWVIANHGIVFGTRFDEDWTVLFDSAETLEELESLKTSKYVQADTNGIFTKIKKQLADNRWVLFVATPCQVKALRLFLRKEYTTLITVDIICHGVPSPLAWKRYLGYRKKEDVGNSDEYKILNVNFRDKRISWEKHCLTIKYQSTESQICYSQCLSDDIYIRLFESNVMLRPSCYSCNSKSGNSGSDITIGDFWGIEKVVPEFNNHKGCSIVVVHTALGEKIMSLLNVDIVRVDETQALASNPSYFHSTPAEQKRESFFKLLEETTDFESIKNLLYPPLTPLQRLKKSIIVRLNKFTSR